MRLLDSDELSSAFPFASFSRAEDSPNFLDFLARASPTDIEERFAKYGRTAAHSEPQVIQKISPIEMVEQIDEQSRDHSKLKDLQPHRSQEVLSQAIFWNSPNPSRRRKQKRVRRLNSCKLSRLAQECPQEENAENKENYNPDHRMTNSELGPTKRFLPGGWPAFCIACATNGKSF
jgi:hypothetical protein